MRTGADLLLTLLMGGWLYGLTAGRVLKFAGVGAKAGGCPGAGAVERSEVVLALDGFDLTDAVITADALHTQHDHAIHLHERRAHYLAVVKRNHPGLHERVRRLPWRDIRLDHIERTRAHHRDEIRRLKTAAFAHIDCPHARQALQVVR